MNHLYYTIDQQTILVMQKSHLLIMLYSSENQHSRKRNFTKRSYCQSYWHLTVQTLQLKAAHDHRIYNPLIQSTQPVCINITYCMLQQVHELLKPVKFFSTNCQYFALINSLSSSSVYLDYLPTSSLSLILMIYMTV